MGSQLVQEMESRLQGISSSGGYVIEPGGDSAADNAHEKTTTTTSTTTSSTTDTTAAIDLRGRGAACRVLASLDFVRLGL